MNTSPRLYVPPAEGSDSIPLETWRELYDLAARVRALAPWQWMQETHVFGVRDPGDGETLYVSVMGTRGIYEAIALYPCTKAFCRFRDKPREAYDDDSGYSILGVHQLQLSFDGKKFLTPGERDLFERKGLLPNSRYWPCFRSYRPGFLPWLIEAHEAQWLRTALGQLLDVGPRVRQEPELLFPGAHDCKYLVRVAHTDGPEISWHDTYERCPPHNDKIMIDVSQDVIDAVRACESMDGIVELDVVPGTATVRQEGERPMLPYLLIAINGL